MRDAAYVIPVKAGILTRGLDLLLCYSLVDVCLAVCNPFVRAKSRKSWERQ
jgi:hypothetical protein